jgi:DNA-binding transcriptional MerR regulator
MLISELAEKVGRHPETIRRLEKRGLISSTRDINNWRHYSPETVAQLRKLYAQTDDHKEVQKLR